MRKEESYEQSSAPCPIEPNMSKPIYYPPDHEWSEKESHLEEIRHAMKANESEIEPKPAAEGTPRTEAMIDSCGDYENAYHYNGRFADFARTLERELDVMTKLYKESCESHYAAGSTLSAIRPIVLHKCPFCPDQGWYAERDHGTGEPVQVQCEFCYTTPNSVFNHNAAAPAEPQRADPIPPHILANARQDTIHTDLPNQRVPISVPQRAKPVAVVSKQAAGTGVYLGTGESYAIPEHLIVVMLKPLELGTYLYAAPQSSSPEDRRILFDACKECVNSRNCHALGYCRQHCGPPHG